MPDRAGSDLRNPRTAGPSATVREEHAVAYHDTDADATAAIADHLAAGLADGERVVAVATEAHRDAVARILSGRGFDLDAARAEHRLVELDAEETLAAIAVGDGIDRARFVDRIDPVLGPPASRRPVRVFGEMVALLWERGQVTAALELETRWNELADRRSFRLLCGYPVDTLADASLGQIGQVCDLHSVLVPPRSYGAATAPAEPAPGSRDRSEVFLPVASAVPAARRFVDGVLGAWGAEEVAWDAAVVTSELATNAVRHGSSPFRASVQRVDGAVRIAVEDVAPGWPDRGDRSVTALTGRGVAIVAALASRSGCHALDEGKVAWAELAVTETA
jgi:DcmR-like sensory protein/histidine kinase-like protein